MRCNSRRVNYVYAPLRDFIFNISDFQRKYRDDASFNFNRHADFPFENINLRQSKILLKSLWDYDWDKHSELHYMDFLWSLNLKESVSNLDDAEAEKFARELFDKIEDKIFDIIYYQATKDKKAVGVAFGLHPSKI